jgi:hypothetical protein
MMTAARVQGLYSRCNPLHQHRAAARSCHSSRRRYSIMKTTCLQTGALVVGGLGGRSAGSLTVVVVRWPGMLCAETMPLCASKTPFMIANQSGAAARHANASVPRLIRPAEPVEDVCQILRCYPGARGCNLEKKRCAPALAPLSPAGRPDPQAPWHVQSSTVGEASR